MVLGASAVQRGVPPSVRTTASVLTTFPIFYAILKGTHLYAQGCDLS